MDSSKVRCVQFCGGGHIPSIDDLKIRKWRILPRIVNSDYDSGQDSPFLSAAILRLSNVSRRNGRVCVSAKLNAEKLPVRTL